MKTSSDCFRDGCLYTEWSGDSGLCVLCGPGLPEDFSSKDYRPSSGPYCFIEQLCELHDGLVLEAKGVKEHFWKPFIKKLFHKRVRPASILLFTLIVTKYNSVFTVNVCVFVQIHL